MSAAFDYSRPKASADHLLARYGQTGILRRPTTSGPAYKPTGGAPDDHAATFAVLDYSNRQIDGARILATDKLVYLAKGSLTIEPAPNKDLLVIGGVEHKIVAVKPLSPAGTVILWELQCRR